MGPPNVLGLPKPASSISTTRTFGAPSGGFAWPISPQSGLEPPSVSFATPLKAGRRIGSLLRSIVWSLTCRYLPRVAVAGARAFVHDEHAKVAASQREP